MSHTALTWVEEHSPYRRVTYLVELKDDGRAKLYRVSDELPGRQ